MKIPTRRDDPYMVEAVLRALDVLEAFDGRRELSLHELSRSTGMNKSRCFRLLHTLVSRKYIERASNGEAYRLGTQRLDRAVGERRDLREIAHAHLVRLRDRFNETVNLGLIHNREVLYIDLVESQRPFRMAAMVGSRMSVESTAMGKAMLSRMCTDTVQSTMAGRAIPRALTLELDRVRRCGYSIDDEQNEPGVACIGAPILDAHGSPAAAISVSGPVHRILEREREVAKALRSACGEISRELGFSVQDCASACTARATKETPRYRTL